MLHFAILCLPYCLIMNIKSTLNRLLFLIIPLIATHTILRLFQLSRVDAFGKPFVGKVEWYIFHAISIDFRWIVWSTLPFILLALFKKFKHSSALITTYLCLHGIIMLLTVADNETYRFLGGHGSFNLINTYGNAASMKETVLFLFEDASIPFLPFVLLFGAIPLFHLIKKQLDRTTQGFSTKRMLIVFAILFSVFYLFNEVIWRGGNREHKLRPIVVTLWKEINSLKGISIEPERLNRITKNFQQEWLTIQGDSSYLFTDSELPYYKTPLFQICSANPQRPECTIDRDQDGFNAALDCNDFNAAMNPQAIEIASNGIDENCSGLDAKPKNIIMIILESHRAINAGYLKKYGAITDGTPFQNKLADSSHYWTRLNTSGTPTIAALTTTHMSILQHPKKFVASAYPQLKNNAFTKVLGDNGFTTRFFSSADPSWDNQTPWLNQWYHNFDYSRSRENDRDMFAHMAQWLQDSISTKPFFVSAISKVNHYPFNEVDGMPSHPKDSPLLDRMNATMRFTENAVEKLFESIQNEPWFKNTLFIITADHGFSLGEHKNASVAHGKYLEYTWVPFLVYGSHPMLGAPQAHTYPANQFDIGPTILDLVGIETANHFVGHSLLRKNTQKTNSSFFTKHTQAIFERDSLRVHIPLEQSKKSMGQIFNRLTDPRESHNIASKHPALLDSLITYAQDRTDLNAWIIENNRLWKENN